MLMARRLPQPSPSDSDLKSFSALRAWFVRTYGLLFPEAELRQDRDLNPDGRISNPRIPPMVPEAILEGVKKPDYASIRVPALALYAVPRSVQETVPPTVNVDDPVALERYALIVASRESSRTEFTTHVAKGRVVNLQGAHHYIFLSNEADVLREMREFLSSLR
jgi:hypothetical protein